MIVDDLCRYYVGCDAIFNQANGTLESPAYGVEDYPHNQVKKILENRQRRHLLAILTVSHSGAHLPGAPPRGGATLHEV